MGVGDSVSTRVPRNDKWTCRKKPQTRVNVVYVVVVAVVVVIVVVGGVVVIVCVYMCMLYVC